MPVERPPTVLIVEDDPGIAELERLRLEEAGYRANLAGSAEEALARLSGGGVDLVLLDYLLPDLDGLAFYDRLKQAGHDLPVILVTALSDEGTILKALRAHVRDFVTKSVEYLDYLPEAVGRVLKQVETERQLAESEARLAAVIGSAKDAILIAGADQRVTLFNAAAEQRFGYPAAQALGQPISRFIPKELHAPPDAQGQPVESLSHVVRWGNRGVRADGEEFPIEASVSRTSAGGQKLYTVVVRDVTERRRAEEALRQAAGDLAEAQGIARLGSWRWQVGADRVTWSDELCRIFGLDPGGHPATFEAVFERIHPGDRERCRRVVEEALRTGEPFTCRHRIVCPDGAVRELEGRGKVVANGDGAPREIVGTAQDVTEARRAEERLRLLGAAVEQETSAVVITTAELDLPGPRILFVNPAFTRMTGYSAEEVIGQTPRLLQGPRTDRAVLDELRARLSRGEEFYGEAVNYRKDGTPYHLGWHVNPIRDGDGRVTHYVSVQRDITERKRAEEEAERRARFKAFGEGVMVAFAQSGALRQVLQGCAEAVVRHLGAAFARVWTLNEQEGVLELQASAGLDTHLDGPHGRVPVGQGEVGWIARERKAHLTNDIPGDPHVGDREWARREGMVAFAGHPLVVENRLVGVIALFARQPLPPDTLDALGSVADTIAQGIERKRAEERLRQQAVLLDKATDAILLLDPEDRVLYWNRGAERLYGWTAAEALGHRVEALYAREHITERQEALRAVAERGEWGGELPRVTRAGRQLTVESRWTLLRDDAGRPRGKLLIDTDVTEKKKLEAQLLHAQRMEGIGQLAGGVAHDFNNLLTIISGYSEILLAGLRPGDRSYDLLREIHRAGDRAASLTRQLLAFSRKQILAPKVLDLNALVAEAEKMLGRLIGEDVALAAVLDPALGKVKADPGQIEQILVNLAVNARDAMPTGGHITVETRNVELEESYTRGHEDVRPGPYVLLTVTDTGCGMDEATRVRIFEPFFTTKEVGKGTGLGLSTVFGIVKQSGGHIAVYSEPGRGTTFKIYLPRVVETEPADASAAASYRMPRGTETILLAEDEGAARAMVRMALEGQGYTVLEAGDGEEAARLFRQHPGPVHLLLTDVVMPRMSGRQLAELAVGLRPQTKVLYVSGYTDDAVIRHGVVQAGVPFLQKPFTLAALARKVREVLDG